jgi:hypothetical protein
MGIVETNRTGMVRRSKLGVLGGGALVAAAVFASAPRLAHGQTDTFIATGGTSGDPTSPGAVTWFNANNWSLGTIPEEASATTVNISANNVAMPAVGAVFDPVHDPNIPGGINITNYVANLEATGASFYIASSPGTSISPNKLTIESGTMIVGTATIGRDAPGILALNGGTFIVAGGTLKVQGSNRSTLLGTGTFEYHGGNLETLQGVQLGSGACSVGAAKTSAGVGYFVVYNDGPDGAILSQNGFQFAANTNQKGTIGIVEFHYDNNSGGVGGVRPIQTNWNNGNGESGQGILHLSNNTNASSRLNLVLDTAPVVIGAPPFDLNGGRPQNLGLFDETLIAGSGTYPKAFYSVDGSRVFTQGATISAAYAGITYSWTISYSGQINFSNTATSAYNAFLAEPPTEINLDSTGIEATGGSDVVLIGLPISVPEPSSVAALGTLGTLMLARRRNRGKAKG